jgi:nucleotide-binding universal stress UspA family protein
MSEGLIKRFIARHDARDSFALRARVLIRPTHIQVLNMAPINDNPGIFSRILIAVDGSTSNHTAVDTGLNLAKALGSEVTALCVFDVGSYGNYASSDGSSQERDYIVKVSEESLSYIVAQSKEMGVKVVPKIVSGHPAEVIVNESAKYDLVVTGTLGRTGMRRAIIGSVAEKVVRLSKCPVLVCRNPTDN